MPVGMNTIREPETTNPSVSATFGSGEVNVNLPAAGWEADLSVVIRSFDEHSCADHPALGKEGHRKPVQRKRNGGNSKRSQQSKGFNTLKVITAATTK